MNLINKKYEDKLKIIDAIDRQYLMNAKNKNNDTNKNIERNNNINSNELLKNATGERFDKIYSDFLLNENSYYSIYGGIYKKNYSMNNNNFDKVPTNEDSYLQKETKKPISIEKKILNNNVNEVFEQNNSALDVGERLYNYGKYLNNKLANLRRIQDNNFKKLLIPKNYSKSQNNSRNYIKISERLYQNKKKKKKKNNTSNDSTNFSYHPKLNKNSILIAEKLEPSFIRLNKKKKIKNIKESNHKSYYLNLYGNSLSQNITTQDINKGIYPFKNKENSKKKDKNNQNIFEKMNNLYLRGIEEKQKKEKKYNENKRKKEDEYKKFSFKPYLNKNINIFKIDEKKTSTKNNKKNNSKKDNKNIYKRQFEWKKKIEKKLNKKKEKNEEIIKKLYTFKPESYTQNYKNNDKYNNIALEQTNEYVIRRRKYIKEKEKEEKYKNKKLGRNRGDFSIGSTIPQEFELETEIRNKDLNKNKNRSCKDFHLKNKADLKEKNSDKKSLNDENGKNYWFFREDINNFSNNNTKGSNKVSETPSQFDFIEAVNMLHDKLDKLNI